MTIKPDDYEERFWSDITTINQKPGGLIRVRFASTDTLLEVRIESPDRSVEYHYLRMHLIQSKLDPYYLPSLGLNCWFAYDNIDAGHYFESRKFAMYTLATWFDDSVYDAEQKALRVAAEGIRG
jgi:hypothetical protein